MNLTDPRAIRAALEKSGFKFSKSKGQNFLVDPGVPQRIASYVDGTMGALEIGPGFGALTQALCGRAGRVVSVELDSKLIPVLKRNLEGCENLTLIEGDALKLDLCALAGEHFEDLTPVVAANIPYSITSQLITKLISSPSYRVLMLMVQAEVAARICAVPGTKAYGAFSVFVKVYCTPEMLFGVPPESFMPRPEVNSSVIRLVRRDVPLVPGEHEDMFFKVVRGAFSQRRKTLKNALSSAFRTDAAEMGEILAAAGTDPGLRGEALDIEAFIGITKEMEKRLCAP